MSNTKRRFNLHEDWTVVILGLLTIFVTLFGFILPIPVFNWGNSAELFSKVLSVKNLQVILFQFLFIIIIAGLGAFISNIPLKYFALGFPILYILTIISLIVAGSTATRALNLEAV